MSETIKSFHLQIPQSELDDLWRRLDATRWPEQQPVSDWSQGVPLHNLRALWEYWRTQYDWRRCEAALNGFGQFRTAIDGLNIHFLHVRSPQANALPLLLTHGWPGSVLEFHKVIGPLVNPAAHGGNTADAFHLVIPSLPGFAFSDKPSGVGWGIERIAGAWSELMRRLGYKRFGAQGGDWGAAITKTIAKQARPGCIGIHLNMPLVAPTAEEIRNASPQERKILDDIDAFTTNDSAYGHLQNTRPQTIGYALADSPMGLAAWIYEKLYSWSDNPGAPEQLFSWDEILDSIMLYWLTNSGASSARLYWESWVAAFISHPIDLPVGVSVFPREPIRSSRRWAERFFRNIIYWNELPKGGHFAAFEQPLLFVNEVAASFSALR